MYGRVPRRCSDLARRRTPDDPISPWWDLREKALQEGVVPREKLEPALDHLECCCGIDFDDFTHTWRDDGFKALSAEEKKPYKDKLKAVENGHYSGNEKDPAPTSKNTKVQVTVAFGTWDLLNSWASAEDRGLSEVANAAIQAGLRALRADGVIPKAALDLYEMQCEKRLVAAQARRVVTDFVEDCIEINF